MGLRKRLRKRGYVLMSDDRSTSIIDLRRWLSEEIRSRDESRTYNYSRHSELEIKIDEQEVVIDLLKTKYKITLERIVKLEDNNE